MIFGNYNIKPVSLFIPDDPQWVLRDELGKQYFYEQGIEDIHWVNGIHGQKWGIQGRHIFLLDNRAEEQFYIGDNKVACFLSMYVAYSVMNALSDSHFLFLETDCIFQDGWKEKLEQEIKNVPSDFDVLFVGSCCAKDKEPVHVAGDVYHFPYRGKEKWQYYPQCAHAMIIAKKAIPTILNTQRDTATPADISMIRFAFPSLNVYAILPTLATQSKTHLPE